MLGWPLLAALPCPLTMPDLAQGPPHHAPVQMPADSEHTGMGAEIFPRIPPDDDKVIPPIRRVAPRSPPHARTARPPSAGIHLAIARWRSFSVFGTLTTPRASGGGSTHTVSRRFNTYVDEYLESAERTEPYQVNTAHTIHSGGQGVGCHSHL